MTTIETLLFVAGLLHFSILLASGLVPRVLNWNAELAKLPELFQQLIWVHGAYIVLMIIGFGAVSVGLPGGAGGRIQAGPRDLWFHRSLLGRPAGRSIDLLSARGLSDQPRPADRLQCADRPVCILHRGLWLVGVWGDSLTRFRMPNGFPRTVFYGIRLTGK